MQKNKVKRDLTTGSITGNLLKVSVPTIIAFFAHTINDLVDMIWIGRISSEAVAGVTIFTMVFWLVAVLNNIIGTSSISLISQSFGAKNYERSRIVIEQTFSFKLLVAVLVAVLMLIFIEPLFALFTDNEEVLRHSLDYGYIRIYFLPVMFSTFTVSTSLICIGDAKRQMVLMIFSSALNIILDPIFIFDEVPLIGIKGLGYGVYGAAIATVISFTFAFIFGFYILLSGKSYVKIKLKGLFKIDPELAKKLITIGAPAGLENFFRSGAGLVTLKVVGIFGTPAVAVMGIMHRLMSLVVIPLFGLLRGGSTVVGQNIGAGKIDRAEKTCWSAAVFGAVLMIVFAAFAFFNAEFLIKVFSDDPELLEPGITMIKWVFPGLISIGVALGLASAFPGSGDNFPMLASSIISKWVIQIPVMLAFIFWMDLSLTYVWVSFVIAEFFEFVIIFYYFKKGRWKTKKV